MVQNVYIAKAVEDKFKLETNKSGLINDLLLQHYGKAPSSNQKYSPKRRDAMNDTFKNIPGLVAAAEIEEPECSRHHVPKSQCVGRH